MQKNYSTPSLKIMTMATSDVVRTSTAYDSQTGDHIQYWSTNS